LSELALGRLGFGAANLGNLYRAITDAEANDILEAAWASGIRYFDTAPHYGLGLSERRLGDFLRTRPREDYVVSTKVGRLLRPNPNGAGYLDTDNDFAVEATLKRVWDPSPEGIRASLSESLERLGLDRVDILYLHDPERYDLVRGTSEAIPALAELRADGLVTAIGVGSMSTEALLASVHTDLVDLLMVAGRYTLAEQPVYPEVIAECARRGTRIVAAAVFNSGLLARNSINPDTRYNYGTVGIHTYDRVRRIMEVCREFDVGLPAAALQYPLRDPVVRNVVVGASNADQIRQNVARARQPIPDNFWMRLIELELIPV
jgi:D-threo-aldose 1-dehydrogenase